MTGKSSYGAYQQYVLVPEITVAAVPDSIGLEKAVVLPLAISTAAAGLYQSDQLGLPYPTKGAKNSGKTVLIWGGSSSVGSTAIQLAVASGLTVVSTGSSRNHDYIKSLGAKYVFDYNSSSVVDDVLKALKEGEFSGVFDAVSSADTVKTCAKIAEALGGGKIATVLPPPEGLPSGVQVKGVFAPSITYQERAVGEAVWGEFVPQALADGTLQCKPDPLVVKGGLGAVQEGLNKQKAGVSASKIVVEISQ
jgi:NADPH:quinone reductase-like Zn-dependent oxidoreductase